MNVEIAKTSRTMQSGKTAAVEETVSKKTPGIGWIGAIISVMVMYIIYSSRIKKS